MKITTNHPESKHGRPVVLDHKGNVLEPHIGLRLIHEELGITRAQSARIVGKSYHTIKAYTAGQRTIPAEVFYALAAEL